MKIITSTALLIAVVLSTQTFAGDVAKGKKIAAGVCAGCHNADGNSIIPINPSLAGQHAEYITKQLKDFKEEEEGTPAKRVSPVMAPMVAALTPEEMEDLGAYYAQQKLEPNPPNSSKNEDKLALGKRLYLAGNLENEVPACASCHSPDGSGIPPHYPRLAGQHADYTMAQLKAFNDGLRKNDDNVMRKVLNRMSAKEKRAVADYISQLQ